MSISSNTNLRIVIVKMAPYEKSNTVSFQQFYYLSCSLNVGLVKGRFPIQGNHCEGVVSEQSRVKVEAANLSLEICAWH